MNEQSYVDLIGRALKLEWVKLNTRTYLESLLSSFEKHGGISEKQQQALVSILAELGILSKTSSTTVVKDSAQTETRETPKLRLIKGSCGECHDGLIFCYSKENNYSYVFKCECGVGAQRDETYSRFLSMHRPFYEIQML